MADLGFLPGVKRIMDRTPKVGQRMLFSATLDNGVDVLVKRYLTNPTTHSVDPAVAPVVDDDPPRASASTPPTRRRSSASSPPASAAALLFTRTKHQAKKLAKQLTAAGVPAVDLHGNLSQNARERNLEAFTDGATRVLVRDRHRRPRHPRRRRRARRARRPAGRAQGLPAPLGPHRPRRRRGRRRHHRHARPGRRGPHAGPAGRHPPPRCRRSSPAPARSPR